ncbi:MAG: GTP 3',8-cyclase MoaA [Phycisphaerales bacterium]|nr:GTP 3',8-cyclase MoaA [Phycisphaerales bacterium]
MQFDVREPECVSDVIAVSLPQFRAVDEVGRNAATKRSQKATPEQLPAAPAHIRAGGRMMDSHGRTILDLRISITDRCNFRCVYCMEPDVQFQPRENVMTPGEIIRMARVAQSLGVRKIRLTGGEPTLHPQLTEIISGIRAATDVEIAMISNGSLLTRQKLSTWKRAGLDRMTISIDSVRADRFARVTRSTVTPEDVIAGIEMCVVEGLTPLKLNAVLVRGQNDDEAVELARLARRFGVEMRFIEYMPLDSAHAWNRALMVTARETRAAIEAVFELTPTNMDDAHSTARTYRFTDGAPGRIGFIAPVSNPFCGACSRLRLTADGNVRPCLFSTKEWSAMKLLRGGASDAELANFLIDVTWTKLAGHNIASPKFVQPARPMSAVGG